MGTLFSGYSVMARPTTEIFRVQLIEMGDEQPFRNDHSNSGFPAG